MIVSRMSSSVVPGSSRQSSSIVASPGITLYFTPAWMMFGLTVSRRSARITRAGIGSQIASRRRLAEPRIVAGERTQEPGLLAVELVRDAARGTSASRRSAAGRPGRPAG